MSAVTFRVHFEDGRTVDVTADNPGDAREAAKAIRGAGRVTKVKVVREDQHA